MRRLTTSIPALAVFVLLGWFWFKAKAAPMVKTKTPDSAVANLDAGFAKSDAGMSEADAGPLP